MADEFMMRPGDYTFTLDSAAYQTLSRRSAWRWPAQARIGRAAIYRARQRHAHFER